MRRPELTTVALFHVFLIGTSFLKERADRQMFSLRQQLKIQYRSVGDTTLFRAR